MTQQGSLPHWLVPGTLLPGSSTRRRCVRFVVYGEEGKMSDSGPDYEALAGARAKATWMAGDFGQIAQSIQSHADAFIARREDPRRDAGVGRGVRDRQPGDPRRGGGHQPEARGAVRRDVDRHDRDRVPDAGWLSAASANLQTLVDRWASAAELSIFLRDDVDEETRQALRPKQARGPV